MPWTLKSDLTSEYISDAELNKKNYKAVQAHVTETNLPARSAAQPQLWIYSKSRQSFAKVIEHHGVSTIP
jgi:hypothetical protein